MNEELNQMNLGTSNEPPPQVDPHAALKENHRLMLKEIRSWGLWSLGLGVVHLISSGFLNSAWGILLILVGLASFYYRTASMFIIYTVTLSWAALSNLVSFNPEWMIFAAVQVYMAFRTFKDFRRFQNAENELIAVTSVAGDDDLSALRKRSARFFPWIGSILGCLSIVICMASVVVVVFVIDESLIANMVFPPYFLVLTGLTEIMGVLGFSVSMASLISNYKPKALPIIGLVFSGLIMVLMLVANLPIF